MNNRIALFLHHPKCSVQCGNGILKALGNKYQFKVFTKHELEDDFFDDVDMVAVPGGVGDSESFHSLMGTNGQRIINFVQNGGRYLGICMGAYWTGKHYFNLLQNADAVQYITRPNTDTRRPHPKNIDITWLNQPMQMYFYDGCAIAGDESKFQTIARYANGDPMAIIQDRIGLIGCHPESEPSWFEQPSWMRGKYHNGKHHKLLLDFVDRLML